MASFHCTVRVGKSGKAAKHAAYICREDDYANLPRNTTEELLHTQSGNMPTWAKDRTATFWEMSDLHERKNGTVYREIEIALPNELTTKQQIDLVNDFATSLLKGKHAYTYGIHSPNSKLGEGKQTHAHFMYSERINDGIERGPDKYFKRANKAHPEKGGCVKDSAGTEERLLETRKLWATKQNLHLELLGHTARVDHRSLKDQGIARSPERHLGHVGMSMLTEEQKDLMRDSRNTNTKRAELYREYKSANIDFISEIAKLKKEKELEKAEREKEEKRAKAEEQKPEINNTMVIQTEKEIKNEERKKQGLLFKNRVIEKIKEMDNRLPAPILQDKEENGRRDLEQANNDYDEIIEIERECQKIWNKFEIDPISFGDITTILREKRVELYVKMEELEQYQEPEQRNERDQGMSR